MWSKCLIFLKFNCAFSRVFVRLPYLRFLKTWDKHCLVFNGCKNNAVQIKPLSFTDVLLPSLQKWIRRSWRTEDDHNRDWMNGAKSCWKHAEWQDGSQVNPFLLWKMQRTTDPDIFASSLFSKDTRKGLLWGRGGSTRSLLFAWILACALVTKTLDPSLSNGPIHTGHRGARKYCMQKMEHCKQHQRICKQICGRPVWTGFYVARNVLVCQLRIWPPGLLQQKFVSGQGGGKRKTPFSNYLRTKTTHENES